MLHTIGSHGPTYYNRYPAAFRKFTPTCDTNEIQGCTREQLTNTYDNTILYVDYVVDKAIKLLQSKQDKFTTSLVYLSDHGESLGEDGVYLHGLPYSIAPDTQKHVPMALWLSADYQQRYGISAHCPLLLQGLILAMQSEGYVCDGVSTAHEAALSLASNHYSLIVLDLGLPDEDGLHFLSRMRREKMTQPVLILTARDTLEDRISGLDTGADDYLVKPFALEELNARIRALLRRHNNQGDNEISVGNLRLNVTRRLVWLGETALDLTPKEYALLSRLMMKAGSPVHREILYNDIYSWDNEPATNTLEVHIHNLREKIGKSRIRTVRGFGYMLANNIDTE